MIDLEQEIRMRLKAWEQAPGGSKQEAIAKAEYERLSAYHLYQLPTAVCISPVPTAAVLVVRLIL